MIDAASLVPALKRQVLILEDDLRRRLDQLADRRAEWQSEHRRLVEADRTANGWTAWRDDQITQAAVAWVLTGVFVRFCEDNALLKPVWIAGPRSRRQEALDAQLAYFRKNPDHSDREWLEQAIGYLGQRPATAGLVDEHSALRLISPSGQAVSDLIAFWRQQDDTGDLLYDFTDSSLSTRFLGDLYQDLSDYAKKTFALLQTPEFVEEFILDQTLEPALKERPLEGFRLIDPTCGSGHFLLGAFERLLARWDKAAPGMEVQARVRLALESIFGVDLNAFAVAIARFRLTVAALQACELRSLEAAPAFDYHVLTGDSLLFGNPNLALPIDGADPDLAASQISYSTEDVDQLREVLQAGRYDVVVGNPPYITVKDKKLNARYRALHTACKGTYALTVPFMQRFFKLAKESVGDQPAGWIGQITSNSFMKREFGSKLIEEFLIKQDLRLVVDTSGAYIPGHGTPTVIIVGRHQRPEGSTLRTVLGIRGEPGRPDKPEKGLVWSAIVRNSDAPGHEDSWISVTDSPRESLARHPWSLKGGGAVGLRGRLERSERTLSGYVAEVGYGAVTREDSAYMVGAGALRRFCIPKMHQRLLVEGDTVRDWSINDATVSLWPYDPHSMTAVSSRAATRMLWPLKRLLSDRVAYGLTQLERGLQWFEYSMFFTRRFTRSRSITFAEVATHNHFVLDRGGKVFKQTAPVIKLSEEASDDDHLALLGVLNSSTACFWLKQNSHNKGEGGGARVDAGYAAGGESFRETYQFNSTTLRDLPMPADLPLERGRLLDSLAQQAVQHAPRQVASHTTPTRNRLEGARTELEPLRGQMIAQQEELDWEVYGHYGLCGGDLVYDGDDLLELRSGERAFEISLARKVVASGEETTWFKHPLQTSTPITEIPDHWPPAYSDLVQRRLNLIESDPNIRLLEKPEHKRRWATESWEKQQEAALRGWLLDRLEDKRFWFAEARPAPKSIGQLADQVSRDPDLISVLALWEGRPDVPVVQSLIKLLTDEAVPYLAAYRLKDSGLRKFEAWQETWNLQRREDAGEEVGLIPVPPKYTSADFKKQSWWQARGKLDVPKERFVLYPDAGRSTDPTPLLGWAGWDHAQQALAVAMIIAEREEEGWEDARLIPLVAGLAELQPWVEQWHADVDPTFGVSLAAFCREQLVERSRQVGRSPEELAAWKPEATRRGRRART